MDAAGWDEIAQAYHHHIVSPYATDAPEIRARLAAAIRDALARSPAGMMARPARVLDAGCGPGNLVGLWAEALAECPLEMLVGLDFAEAALGRARAAARGAGLGFTAVRADLGDLALAGGFDVVVSVNACLPAPGPKRSRTPVTAQLDELARVLTPGGVLVAVLPSFDAELAELERQLRGSGPARAYDRRQLHRSRRLDERSASMDSGWGDLLCLHTPTTITAELASAGLELVTGPERIAYPEATCARLGYAPGAAVWDWLVTARRPA